MYAFIHYIRIGRALGKFINIEKMQQKNKMQTFIIAGIIFNLRALFLAVLPHHCKRVASASAARILVSVYARWLRYFEQLLGE